MVQESHANGFRILSRKKNYRHYVRRLFQASAAASAASSAAPSAASSAASSAAAAAFFAHGASRPPPAILNDSETYHHVSS